MLRCSFISPHAEHQLKAVSAHNIDVPKDPSLGAVTLGVSVGGTAGASGAFAATLLDDAAGDEINGAAGGSTGALTTVAFGSAVPFSCGCLLSDCSYLYASGR